MNTEDKKADHFIKIFWFLAGTVFMAMLYVYLITFIKIPQENVRFADTTLGFFLGSIIATIVAYFAGGSPPKMPEGKTSASITADVVSDNGAPDPGTDSTLKPTDQK